MQARIQYLALICGEPQVVADYYQSYFGLRVLGASPAGDISVTDGFYNLALLRDRPELGEAPSPIPAPPCAKCGHPSFGIHHLGIAVDDISAVEQRLEQYAPNAELHPENGDLHHGDYRVYDPLGIPISLSTRNFGVPDGERQVPCIRHIALSIPRTVEVADFYVNVFGFRHTTTSMNAASKGSRVRWVGDGSTAMAVLAEPMIRMRSEREADVCAKGGVNHFGFLVPDLRDMLDRLPRDRTDRSNPTRPSAEYRVVDPEGNPVDVSQVKGYEVDVDVWVRFPEVAQAGVGS